MFPWFISVAVAQQGFQEKEEVNLRLKNCVINSSR
jgi:hypothetical protein